MRLSTLRLTLLRLCYAVLVVGLSPPLRASVPRRSAQSPTHGWRRRRSAQRYGALAIAGLFSPVRMLPLLVFEIAWKAIWVIAVALPKWLDGSLDEGYLSILFNCSVALPFVFIVPWRYVAATFLGRAEPFRANADTQLSAT